jgi:hypothetical protein
MKGQCREYAGLGHEGPRRANFKNTPRTSFSANGVARQWFFAESFEKHAGLVP